MKGAVLVTRLLRITSRLPSTADANWTTQLQQVDVVIHCAARVHVMSDKEADPLTAFRAVNTIGTLNLANQAADAGVLHIYLARLSKW